MKQVRIRYEGPSIGEHRCSVYSDDVIWTFLGLQLDVLSYISNYMDDLIAKRRTALTFRESYEEACAYVNEHSVWSDNILNMYVYPVGNDDNCDLRFAFTDCGMEDSGRLEVA